MFSFFKKKPVPETPKSKILKQYMANEESIKKFEKDLNEITEKSTNTIIQESINTIKEDNNMLCELYSTIVDREISFVWVDKMKSNDILDVLKIPATRVNYDIKLFSQGNDNVNINKVNELVGFNLIKTMRDEVVNSAKMYDDLIHLLQRRTDIRRSKLKSKIKDLVIEKQVKQRYNEKIKVMYGKMYPNKHIELLDNFENVQPSLLQKLRPLEKIYCSKYNNSYNNYYKTIVMNDIPTQFNSDVDDFKDDMLLTHQITLCERGSVI